MKHIAWDFDGTLVDSFRTWKQVMTAYCLNNALSLPEDTALKASFGNTQWQGFPGWNLPFETQNKHRFLAYDQFYIIQKNSPDSLPPVAGIVETLKKLAAQRFVQSVVTSRPRQKLLDMIGHLKIGDFFRIYNAAEDAEENHLQDKPAPDKLLFVMNRISAQPADTIMIGDTVMDIGMATSAHVRSVGVTWGMGSDKELSQAGASRIVKHPHDLIGIIQQLI